ncbi:malonate transporter, MadM subunit [Rhodopseudomonas palustris HaA2]|uniref:Malonate transporter, MadM subunit n=1 Tax=Rhodopseudomonas palustris (strain HaA2) TaxID=316058 RepID=Q2IUX4_RHOP2|nr:malonate transporter subunit MadM [Rhodopseudomonas palustris]ABD07986.1 malonate transporter, MadM subunit [Rhodopseudomonas palustris HaA2]
MTHFINDLIGPRQLIFAFVLVGLLTWLCYAFSKHVTKNRIHGSAVAIIIGLALAYYGGISTGGKRGIADISVFAGFALMGGAMLRDFCIVSTAFGVRLEELKKAGLGGVLALVIGTVLAFIVGVGVAYAFGYRDTVSLTTIGAGSVTFIVGPVTGSALGATSDVIALSIAAGVVKSIAVMILTPFLAKPFGLTNPAAAMVYGGLMGTTSGTAAGLAATDVRLVPYGALTATFYTGFGCLVCPSILYLVMKAIFG